VERFANDLNVLRSLLLAESPPEIVAPTRLVLTLLYGFADASGTGFGDVIFEIPARSVGWPAHLYEPLTIGLLFPFLSSPPLTDMSDAKDVLRGVGTAPFVSRVGIGCKGFSAQITIGVSGTSDHATRCGVENVTLPWKE
jgi:hypothetical protein